jgi:hypothetical protein
VSGCILITLHVIYYWFPVSQQQWGNKRRNPPTDAPVLDPEVALGVADQRVALQVDAQRVEGLVHAQPQLAGARWEVPAGRAARISCTSEGLWRIPQHRNLPQLLCGGG